MNALSGRAGHTWHHSEDALFGITEHGLFPPYAPNDYESDLPAFGAKLSDEEIWAVLAYLKSHWNSAELVCARQVMTG